MDGIILTTIVTLCCVLVPSLVLVVIYTCKSRKKKAILLFIDAPDPDNPACALAVWNHLLQGVDSPHLHVVLTGRPANLRTKKEFRDDVPVKDQVPRQAWESTVPNHSQSLLTDSAARISNFLNACGLSSDWYTIYNGGIAPCAPLSDVAHDWEFLFDRKDLITNSPSDEGTVITKLDYNNLVDKYNHLTEDQRESVFLSLLRNYKLSSLSQLRAKLKRSECKEICVFLGGPATALVDLFHGNESAQIRSKVSELYAMFGALSPDKSTLLGNQFNVACDTEAAAQLLIEQMFPNIPMYIIPTETAKLPKLIVSANELEGRGAHPYVVGLIKLWEGTHSGRPQPLFDVLPVMAALPQFRGVFSWSRKKAVIQDWISDGCIRQRLLFTEADRGCMFVSDGTFNSNRECFLQFLDLSFKYKT